MPMLSQAASKRVTAQHPDCVSEFAASALKDSLRSVRRFLKLAANEWHKDDEHVHRLRVAGRRALAAVTLFSGLIPAAEARWMTKRLKAVISAAGQARDLDVLLKDRLPSCGKASDELGRIWKEEREASQRAIVDLHRKLGKSNKLRNHTKSLIRKLLTAAAMEGSPGQTSCSEWIRAHDPEIREPFLAAIPATADVHSLHCWRIETKRLRYIVDILEPALDQQKSHDLKSALTTLQNQLGTLQDHVVAKKRLKQSVKQLGNSRHRKTLRTLIQAKKQQIADSLAVFRSWPDSEDERRLRQQLAETLLSSHQSPLSESPPIQNANSESGHSQSVLF